MPEKELKELMEYCDEFTKENFEELKRNDWELHNKLIKEGVNPSEITKIIRNDEIEKLQKISSQTNFDFNQKIEPSFCERYSFIHNWNIRLIDYAAFFGSIKCFKHLLMNGSDVYNSGKYAIVGKNIEIIHLCLQNHSTFDCAYEAAIVFHRNDIFKYLYENKIIEINDMEKLGKKCISHYNYDIFSFLEKEGLKITENIVRKAAKIGNLYFIKKFLDLNEIHKDILVFSSESGNLELVKYILEKKRIGINEKISKFKNRIWRFIK